MKKLMLIAVVLVLLMGTGAAAYYFLMHGDAQATEVAAPESEPQDLVDPVFVEFNPILLPVLGDDRVEQFVNIVVALEVADDDAAQRVIAAAPRLNDAYLQALYGTLHSHTVAENGVLDLTVIKRRLVQVSGDVLGEGVVLDALVQLVSQRIL